MPLKEYTWFVETVRTVKSEKRLSMEEAVDKTIDEMPKSFQIRKFLIGNRAEVRNMCLTEYNEAETMQMFKEEGIEEGIKEGILVSVRNLMNNMKCSAEQALELIGVPEEERSVYLKML